MTVVWTETGTLFALTLFTAKYVYRGERVSSAARLARADTHRFDPIPSIESFHTVKWFGGRKKKINLPGTIARARAREPDFIPAKCPILSTSIRSLCVINEVPSNGKSPIFRCQKYSCQYQANCNIPSPRVANILIRPRVIFIQRSFTVCARAHAAGSLDYTLFSPAG